MMMKKSVLLALIDVSTRRKRRTATNLVIDLLIKIRFAEQEYLDRIPLHLHESAAYATAEDTVDTLIAATVALAEAFIPCPRSRSRPLFYQLDELPLEY